MKKNKYKIYNVHFPFDLWAKIEKELKKNPQLRDRCNSCNRIIIDILDNYFQKNGTSEKSN